MPVKDKFAQHKMRTNKSPPVKDKFAQRRMRTKKITLVPANNIGYAEFPLTIDPLT